MIEKVLLDYLNSKLDCKCYLEVPNPLPKGEFVVFEKMSGTKENMLYNHDFYFQSYADTMYKATLLNNKVINALDEANQAINNSSLVSTKYVRDYNFTDTTTKKYRYQCIYEIYHLD